MKKNLFIILIILSIIIWLNQDKIFKPKILPITSKTTIGIQNIKPINIPNKYNQNDKQWRDDLLGNTNEKLGNVGCLISSVAMNLSYYQIFINPKELNKKLKNIAGYTQKGWLIWDKLEDITQNKIQIDFPNLSHETIDNLLLKSTPVLVKILIHKQIPHWVLIVGKKNGTYLIYDPLDSTVPLSISKYNSLIYSIRILRVVH